MLVLTRKVSEQIHIGDDIFITVRSVRKSRVRLAISAPPGLAIIRQQAADDQKIDTGGRTKSVNQHFQE